MIDRCWSACEPATRRRQELYEHYVHRLLHLARNRISQRSPTVSTPKTSSSPSSAASSIAFSTAMSRSPTTTSTVPCRRHRAQTLRRSRSHRATQPGSGGRPHEALERGLAECLDLEPSPEAAVAFLDELEHFFRRLNAEDRQILELRLHGYTNEEIAERLGTYDRRVRRAMEHVRALAAISPTEKVLSEVRARQ
jgi:hypothetical protein